MTWNKVMNLRGRDGTTITTSEADPTATEGRLDGDLHINTADLPLWRLQGGSWTLDADLLDVASDEDFYAYMGLPTK